MNPLRTVDAARRWLDQGEGSAAELLALARERAAQLDGGDEPVHAFLSLAGAGEDDGRVGPPAGGGAGREEEGTLEGVPVAVKDNLCTLELPTTCGSRILEGYRSPFEATVVRRLRASGARILGKTNCDEFAMGSSTENSAFGPTRNPVDRARVPGGSSGGSAAAVAAGVVPVALGSDTGGSVRQPAALCGVVGLKPTYGRVSRYGLVAFASSLDQVGVFANRVVDAARALERIAGPDPRDATSAERPVPRATALAATTLAGLVIGVPEEYLGEGLAGAVRSRILETLQLLRAAGAEVREVSLPSTPDAVPCYYVIAPAEASSNLARYDGVRYGRRAPDVRDPLELYARSRGEGFGPEVKRRIMLGTYVLSAGYYEAYYRRAQRLRTRITRDFLRLFGDGVDLLYMPTTPSPAFRLGEKSSDPYEMYLTDVFTVSANLAGLPAISIPIGDVEGLPVGGQLLAPHWQEERLLGAAARLEELVGYRHPLARGDG